MRKQFLTVALVMLAVVGMISTVTADPVASDVADNQSDSTDVTVSISSDIMVDVKPESLTYSTNPDYGTDVRVGTQTLVSNKGFSAIEIQNIGSENIDAIWLNASMPSTNPFGTGTGSNYDAGNFFQVKPDNESGLLKGDEADYHFVNRKEYAWTANHTATSNHQSSQLNTNVPSYIHDEVSATYNSTTSSSSQKDFVEYGRFRAGDEWYVWALPHDQTSSCGGGSNALLVGDTVYNETSIGTVDFTSDGPNGAQPDYTIYPLQDPAGTNYGLARNVQFTTHDGQDDAGTPDTKEYDVLTTCGSGAQPHTIRTRYNVNALGADDLTSEGGVTSFLMQNTNDPQYQLQPGDSVTLKTGIQVPFGVPQGSVEPGVLRVFITADESQQN